MHVELCCSASTLNHIEMQSPIRDMTEAFEGLNMRTLNAVAVFGIALVVAANSAEARTRVGIAIGVPGPWYPYSGYYYYPQPYYYPPIVAVPTAPFTYIQQATPVQEPSENYWYYCADAKAYYPYVKQCPGGWARVSPTPPGAH